MRTLYLSKTFWVPIALIEPGKFFVRLFTLKFWTCGPPGYNQLALSVGSQQGHGGMNDYIAMSMESNLIRAIICNLAIRNFILQEGTSEKLQDHELV
eukprot:scaffold162504_cov21-Prasinocladus_malaysianus.AAC.1